MSKLEQRLVFSAAPSLGLAAEHQQQLSVEWDEINSDPEKWCPREDRERSGAEKFSTEEIVARNIAFGEFATEPIRWLCDRTTVADHNRRLAGEKIVFYAGWGGFSFHKKWFRHVSLASLATCITDVSPVACQSAKTHVFPLWDELLRNESFHPYIPPKNPVINQGEIQSVLVYPDSIELDLNRVEWQIYCRALSAFGKKGSKIVTQISGESLGEERDLGKHNRIITIDPHSENNPERTTAKSAKLSRNQILSNICHGARRPIEVEYEAAYPYFGRVYTAMIIKAE